MALESATYINQLDAALPTSSDDKSEGDDVLRLIKAVLLASFPNVGGAVTVTQAQINSVTGKAAKAGDTYTGAHDFTGATPTVATAATGTSTTAPASTAFVQAAIASLADVGMTLAIDSSAAITAVAGQHIVCTNVSAVTVTLPATPTAGDTVWVTPGNGLTTNVIAGGGEPIMGISEDMTINSANATVALRYINGTLGWRLA